VTHAIVVMGVSGAGKTTLGRALAAALGSQFVEGDTLHPPANVAKMAAGVPLDDADRRPFLESVAAALAAGRERGIVVTCSALKRRYRDLLRAAVPDAVFVLPTVERDALAARLATRHNHYMPASLLDSQLATLEPPTADERAIIVDGGEPTQSQVARVRALLASRSDHATKEGRP
jgi:gluconokinase